MRILPTLALITGVALVAATPSFAATQAATIPSVSASSHSVIATKAMNETVVAQMTKKKKKKKKKA